jgi:hypothetical protein
MMLGHYILVDQSVVEEPDLIKWAEDFESANRIVNQHYVGSYFISTVFLGLDHNFALRGPPKLFETMVFAPDGDGLDLQCWRCSTWLEAEAQHERILVEYERKIGRTREVKIEVADAATD